MPPSVRWQWNGVFHLVRRCGNGRDQWAAARSHRLFHHVYHPVSTEQRYSAGSLLLRGLYLRAFSTTATAYAKVRKATKKLAGDAPFTKSAATKAKEALEALEPPRQKLRLIGASDTATQSQPSPALSEFQEAYLKLNKVMNQYSKMQEEEDSTLWLTYDELKGVSANSMSKWNHAPVKSFQSRKLGLKRRYGSISSVAGTATNPSTRTKITAWDENACQHLEGLYKEMMRLRARIARLGGFKSYFDLKSQFKMMDRRSVAVFLNQLQTEINPRVNSYMEELFEMKYTDMDASPSFARLRQSLVYHGKTIRDFQVAHTPHRLHWGDVSYYSALKRRKDIWGGGYENISPYFPLESTIRKLLPILGHVIGMRFTEVLPHQQKYTTYVSRYLTSPHPRVKRLDKEDLLVFTVEDTSNFLNLGAPLGILVLDLLDRPGKLENPFCALFDDQSLQDAGAGISTKKIPWVAILAGFSRPTSKKPSLLSHVEMETFAHELGHAIHRFVRGGLEEVPWDFIEIPSIIMEYWVGDPKTLQKLSSHYIYQDEAYLKAWKASNTSGEAVPPKQAPIDLFDTIALCRHPGNRMEDFLMTLWRAKFDLIVHSYSEKELEKADLALECQKILTECTGIFSLGPSRNNTYLNWSTSTDAYHTSFYCYLVAHVYTADIWQKFFAKDPLNRKHGLRWRKMVLEHRDYFPSTTVRNKNKRKPFNWFDLPALKLGFWRRGRSENSMDALEKFMGRKLSTKAFVKLLYSPTRRQKSFWTRLGVKLGLAGIFV